MIDGIDCASFYDHKAHRRELLQPPTRQAELAYALLVYAISLAASVTGLLLVIGTP